MQFYAIKCSRANLLISFAIFEIVFNILYHFSMLNSVSRIQIDILPMLACLPIPPSWHMMYLRPKRKF